MTGHASACSSMDNQLLAIHSEADCHCCLPSKGQLTAACRAHPSSVSLLLYPPPTLYPPTHPPRPLTRQRSTMPSTSFMKMPKLVASREVHTRTKNPNSRMTCRCRMGGVW